MTVLAGERGPSCEKMAHVTNRKVFYIRFIKRDEVEVVSDEDGSLECKVIEGFTVADRRHLGSGANTTKFRVNEWGKS